MPRLGKRKRCGQPERLADMIAASSRGDWSPPRAFRHADEEHHDNYWINIALAVNDIPSIPVIESSNVTNFTYAHEVNPRRFRWDTLTIRPPFDHMFIESEAP